ncbi:MAG: DNA alkylation repair protein [Pseudomonadota bacterium]
MRVEEIIERLQAEADPGNLAGMARFGINPEKALGVRVPALRRLARELGRDRTRALELWARGLRETRILASLTDDPAMLTAGQMEAWTAEFYDWEICDQCCANLFEKSPLAWSKAGEWSGREDEFFKRAGFVLMARLAVSDKKTGDKEFENFFPLIEREADDDRNLVKKAVNWALRQIGKRSFHLNGLALETAARIKKRGSRAAGWISSDAIRELTNPAILGRIKR